MNIPTKLSVDAKSNARIRDYVADFEYMRNQLDIIRDVFCKIASSCSSERIQKIGLSDCETYCDDLFVLWRYASECFNLCERTISRLDYILNQNE